MISAAIGLAGASSSGSGKPVTELRLGRFAGGDPSSCLSPAAPAPASATAVALARPCFVALARAVASDPSGSVAGSAAAVSEWEPSGSGVGGAAVGSLAPVSGWAPALVGPSRTAASTSTSCGALPTVGVAPLGRPVGLGLRAARAPVLRVAFSFGVAMLLLRVACRGDAATLLTDWRLEADDWPRAAGLERGVPMLVRRGNGLAGLHSSDTGGVARPGVGLDCVLLPADCTRRFLAGFVSGVRSSSATVRPAWGLRATSGGVSPVAWLFVGLRPNRGVLALSEWLHVTWSDGSVAASPSPENGISRSLLAGGLPNDLRKTGGTATEGFQSGRHGKASSPPTLLRRLLPW
mmetsp:Transcript_76781/g.205087  ORF Transcript_76781/g.205087 Transcript_76781/m.205087 type:complete len:350 (-) Transcript_76781:1862-2911(-)